MVSLMNSPEEGTRVLELIADTELDIDLLPTQEDDRGLGIKAGTGSTVFVINTSKAYMLNSEGVWVSI